MHLATKLVSTRRGTLLAALLIALLAGASILLYLNSYRDSLKAQGALVTVLVAKEAIPKGTAGTVVAAKDLYTVTTIRESQLLEGAMSDPATLRDRVTTREIFQGAQLTASDFAAGGDSLAPQLSDRQRVVSVPLDSARGLIDNLEPGNRVDVFAAVQVPKTSSDGRARGSEVREVVRLIASDVSVMAVGEPGKGAGGSATNVSLRVDDRSAAEVAFAVQYGTLWLALRPSAGAKPSRADIVTVETLILRVPAQEMYKSLGGRP